MSREAMLDRIERAENRADQLSLTIIDTDPLVVQVDSEHSDRVHTLVPESLHCSCEDHTYRFQFCYHVIHALIGESVDGEIQEAAREALDQTVDDVMDRAESLFELDDHVNGRMTELPESETIEVPEPSESDAVSEMLTELSE